MKKSVRFLACVAIVFTILISCVNKNSDKKNTDTVIKTEKVFLPKKKKDVINEPQEVAFQFYKWYLKDIYLKKTVETPDIILSKDSTYVLDATNHKNFLKSSNYFSEKFYDNEIGIFKDCANKLKLVNWKEVEKTGTVNPAEFVSGNDCDFTHYMIWTNGQGETINKVKLEKFEINGKFATVHLKLLDSLRGGFYSKPKVTMINEKGNWKILKIEVGFE